MIENIIATDTIKILLDWFLQILIFSSINSLVVCGTLTAVRCLFTKKGVTKKADIELPQQFSMIMPFVFGYMFVFYFLNNVNDLPVYVRYAQIAFNGFFIGAISIALYESAIKAFLEIIPALYKKFFGI